MKNLILKFNLKFNINNIINERGDYFFMNIYYNRNNP